MLRPRIRQAAPDQWLSIRGAFGQLTNKTFSSIGEGHTQPRSRHRNLESHRASEELTCSAKAGLGTLGREWRQLGECPWGFRVYRSSGCSELTEMAPFSTLRAIISHDAEASPPWQQVFPSGTHPPSLQVIKLVTEVKSQCNPTGDVLGLIRKKRNSAPMECTNYLTCTGRAQRVQLWLDFDKT